MKVKETRLTVLLKAVTLEDLRIARVVNLWIVDPDPSRGHKYLGSICNHAIVEDIDDNTEMEIILRRKDGK